MIAVIAALLIGMQDDVPPPEAQIEKAIKAGTEALLARNLVDASPTVNASMGFDYFALVLYTLVHSGMSLDDGNVQGMIARVSGAPLVRTYQVALTAAALAGIDPMKYQAKLAQCAQYLVDYQCENGQWGYGDKYDFDMKAEAAAGGANKTVAKINIKRIKQLGPAVGDNSNSQYAALGLRACASGGIDVESSTLTRAMDWWERSQQKDGGWSYHYEGTYNKQFGEYGSMTAGAVSSLIIYKHLKKSDPKLSSSITRGMKWLAQNFTVEKNPGAIPHTAGWYHYYLYALERTGDLFPTEKIGKHAWYALGANYLLKTQRSDGMWIGTNPDMTIADTCFALLFLERVARRPPVATGGKPVK
jgi:hypothetical protein